MSCPFCDQALRRLRARHRWGGPPVYVCSICKGILP